MELALAATLRHKCSREPIGSSEVFDIQSRYTMNHEPDTRMSLIARICDRSDNDAWEEFVHIYQPVIQRFLQKYGLQYADAVEITQEVLGGVVKSIETWSGSRTGSTFRGWLYRITRNKAVDFLHNRLPDQRLQRDSKYRLSQLVDPKHQSKSDFDVEFERQVFHWAIEKIKPTVKPINWQAFWLSSVDGHSVKEVAQQLGVDESAVYVARCRIVKRMATLVQLRLDDSQQTELPKDPQ